MTRSALVVSLLLLPTFLVAQEPKQKPLLSLDVGGHTAPVFATFFAPDGKSLWSAAEDRTIRQWDVATGEALRVLRFPAGESKPAVTFSRDGQYLAVAVEEAKKQHWISLLSLADLQVIRLFKGHTDTVIHLAFSPDGKQLASGDWKGTVRVWDVRTGKQQYSLPRGHVEDLAFSTDSKLLASVTRDNDVYLWDAATGRGTTVLKKHEKPVMRLAWSPDGKLLASRDQANVVCLWDAEGALVHRYTLPEKHRGLAFTPDGQVLAGALLVDAATGNELKRLDGVNGSVRAPSVTRDGKIAACGGANSGEVILWDLQDAKQLHLLIGKGRNINRVGWSPNGKTVAMFGRPTATETERFSQTFNLAELTLGGAPGRGYHYSRHKERGLSLEATGPLIVTVKRGEEVVTTFRSPRNLDGTNCYTFLDEKRAVVGANSGLYLYETATGKRLRTFREGELQDPTEIVLRKFQDASMLRSVAPSPNGKYFATGGIDQILRIWSADQDLPLLSLYAEGHEWIAWTPEGYYAASPAGEHLMGWMIANGPGQPATFYPCSQFRKSLYRPDVLKRLLEAGSVAKALAQADLARGNQTALTAIDQVQPPEVAILTPEKSGIVVTEAKLSVKAAATSVGQHPVTALQLFVDGRPHDGDKGLQSLAKVQLGKVEKEWLIDLPPGRHQLMVAAQSAVSSSRSTVVEVSYTPATAPNPNDLRPTMYVLAIGINAYSSVGRLNYAVNDAKDLAEAFKVGGKLLYRKVETQLLLDQEATRANILKGLAWMKKEMQPQDVAVIFFNGHAYRDDKGRLFFLPIDMDEKRLDQTTITGDELKKALADLPGRVLLLLDAVHAGGLQDKDRQSVSVTDEFAREVGSDDFGVIVICAARGSENGRESKEKQHGLFTLALLNGLAGLADYNKDGVVYLGELYLYVENSVWEMSSDMQHPVIARPSTISSFGLTRK